ncbi:glucan biosynthesis protein [Novosphingobium sediminicola]|uniref:Glucans biosynthesis protein n=1 Tax=Novosphingobium sediminicola TaxID=563162 RepID=A0A7W6CLH3_9SPHN|nr:glucan biosynthesis protein [Novosphingobium sediminicola]MBB3953662.1 glucans biosynthesis protein [Novosphingobium sediminicola]
MSTRNPSSAFTRRGVCGGLAGLSILPLARAAGADAAGFGPPQIFSWEALIAHARAMAARPYQPEAAAPGAHGIDFDAAGKLTYGPAPILAGTVRLLPVSRDAPIPVRLNFVEDGQARRLLSGKGMFAHGGSAAPAGLRVLNPRGDGDWLSFLGASYFRTAGAQNQYGISARGVAVDTALAHGEEFPRFTEFWIENQGDARVLIHALIDGPSLSGAMRIDSTNTPGGVVQDVTAVFALRRDIGRLGIAPASSMFWYDQNSPARTGDWRPEIHDSDGLAVVAANGEHLWRALRNPRAPRTNAFALSDPHGFGLMQRDRRFSDYQDDGAFYDRRPNLWVEPIGNWGPGAVMLYEFPTVSETTDNIAAFWVSDMPMRAGGYHEWRYRLHWISHDPSAGAGAHLVDQWSGAGGIPGAIGRQDTRKLVFDFEGDNLAGLDRSSGVEAVTNLPPAAVAAQAAYPVVGAARRWRVTIDIRPAALAQSEFRLFLRHKGAALSETIIEPLADLPA